MKNENSLVKTSSADKVRQFILSEQAGWLWDSRQMLNGAFDVLIINKLSSLRSALSD